MPLTQHYRVYKGGLPHAVFRTDYLQRLRALLPSPGGSDEPSVTGYGSTPTSVRRQRRMSKPTRLFPGSDVNVPILTEQNLAEMVGESVFDCRPPGLPVSIPLSGFSPAMISGARDCTSHQQLEESSRSIMNMDTNEISISGIIGFPWNDSGTDVEDELPSPVASPDPIMSTPLAPADSSDPFGRGVNYDLDLADVFRDATVLPSLVTPLEDTEATVAGTAATYDPPVEPVGTSSPARDSATEESFLQLLREPRELLTVKRPFSGYAGEGSLFAVSPDTPGYSMRPAGAVVQSAVVSEPPPPNYVGFNNPFFGTPIAFAQCQNTAGMDTTTTLPVYNIPRDCSVGVDQSSVPTIYASGVTPDSIPWSTAEDIIRDIAREGPFDPDTTPMDTEDSPLINASMPGCPFRMTSYTGPAMADSDTSYGLQLHHPRFLEFIGAPESARLLNQSPSFWVDRLGQASAMAAAMNLQRDAGFMMTNLQILEQFVMSLHRMSAEMLSIGVDHAVFPVDEVDRLSVMPRAQRAAKYMSAMGLWRPPSGESAPGPLPVSTCTSCMKCESCFGRRGPSAQ